MIKRILQIVIAFMFLYGNAYAAEQIVDFEDKSLPILNEELNRIDGELEEIEDSLGAAGVMFFAYNSSQQANIAKDTDVTVVLDSEYFDVGDDFASNTFTAPVDGYYQLNATINIQNGDISASGYELKIVTTDRTYVAYTVAGDFADNYTTATLAILVNLNEGDTAYVVIAQDGGTGGTVDLWEKLQYFSGYLVEEE